MSRTESFQQALVDCFPEREWAACISLPQHGAAFVIVDELQANGRRRSTIAQEAPADGPGFNVLNPDNKGIYLFALDDCFFTSADPRRCDCLVFDDDCFCFVELKLDVTSRRQAASKLKSARDQLGATILFFRKSFSPETDGFWGAGLEAYAVMRKKLYPRFSASRTQVFTEFLERYGVPLYEKNTKSF